MPDFHRHAVLADIRDAIQHQPAAHAGAQRQVQQAVQRGILAVPGLAQRRQRGVVLHTDGPAHALAQPRGQRQVGNAGDVGGGSHHASVNEAREAQPNGGDARMAGQHGLDVAGEHARHLAVGVRRGRQGGQARFDALRVRYPARAVHDGHADVRAANIQGQHGRGGVRHGQPAPRRVRRSAGPRHPTTNRVAWPGPGCAAMWQGASRRPRPR